MQSFPKDKDPNQDSNSPEPPIYLHAELLPHIRHITLYVSVPDRIELHLHEGVQEPAVEISLSESRRAVSVSVSASLLQDCSSAPAETEPQDGTRVETTETMKLPARVTESARSVLRSLNWRVTTGSSRRREVSFRMIVDDDDGGSAGAALLDEELVGGFVPWRAMDMRAGTRVRCRLCEVVVLDRPGGFDRGLGSGKRGEEEGEGIKGWVWKDLPSGNWAEMMDFWHCHKPDPVDGRHGHDDGDGNDDEEGNGPGDGEKGEQGAKSRLEDPNATVKGYGAANQVVATLGTILVDVATFLVAEGDWLRIQKDPESDGIRCCNCNALLGQADPIANGWRLFKTALSASIPAAAAAASTTQAAPPDNDQLEWETHYVEVIIAAQLLELVERESARRFVVHCGLKSGLLIWVFNPDMRYSNSSADHSIAARRAVKVFFQTLDDVEQTLHPEVGKPSTTLALEELRLPAETYGALKDVLEERNAMLPESAREFREWRVGILHRLERRA
ncbi:HECT-type E3 ubiquitin transferase [Aspergillus homomorphus CBS 101889]|uniref:Ubiquitin-conjugating enzyme E2-binding protein n=1 Tax=Aspergillus homomorphus (strain CBS 101889) TaxID=1450537 RepID=A0A395HSR4_ASPHC|nr:hypothetical protein BO97DRAFT_444315 [Aspergillus homomorphus CBS 101889]RAL10820.1 hypothetical protein BO97DRAFT_444315 [Aspergillus homomorphus CBS 101889]